MKASLKLEHGKGSRTWCAKVSIQRGEYRLTREFLHGKIDWSNASSSGWSGAEAFYILDSGHVYEYKTVREERFFIAVDDEGCLHDGIPRAYVIQYLSGGISWEKLLSASMF